MVRSRSHDADDQPGDDSRPTLTKQLLARYLAGDFAAEERLFARFRATLLERARRHPRMRPIARAHEPDDVVNEVFGRALASGMLRQFEDRGHGSLEAALGKVLDNTLVDLARRMNAEKRGGTISRVEPGQVRAPTSLEHVAADDTTPTSRARSRELLELARQQLDAREFEIWSRIELDGATSVELGERLCLSSSAVRGILFRAQRKLLEALDRGGRGSAGE
jgi:RNA polymerase sigma factor (sigma-70 family)